MPEVIIKINKKDFSYSLDAQGFQGKGCVKNVDEIQQILGGRTVNQNLKPDYQRVVKAQKLNRG